MLSIDEVRESLRGPVASLPTPFDRKGNIDFGALRRFVDFVIEGGTKTMMLTYGDSLFSLLTDAEVAEVTRVVAEQTAGRAMVVAADRMWATPKEVAFARYAKKVGADMLMVLPPDWAASTTVETLVEHYGAVAAEMPVMVVTNYFLSRAEPFGLAVLEAVADRVPGVMAVKDDVCGEFARKMGLRFADRFALISGGQKQNHMNALPYGCDGYLSTFIKFKPRIATDYWRAVESSDIDGASKIIAAYDMPFFDLISHALPGGFDAALHGTLELFGVCPRWRRPPYHSLTDHEMERLAQALRDRKIL